MSEHADTATTAQQPLSAELNQLNHVSSKLVTARLLSWGLPACLTLAVIVAVSLLVHVPTWFWGLALGVWLLSTAWLTFVIVRQVPALGYLCRDDDLLIHRGIMFRRTTLVPYGRMQFVEVSQGPIARQFGLASVNLHTAAALSDASIDGLPYAEAEELRDLLAARGESELAGL